MFKEREEALAVLSNVVREVRKKLTTTTVMGDYEVRHARERCQALGASEVQIWKAIEAGYD